MGSSGPHASAQLREGKRLREMRFSRYVRGRRDGIIITTAVLVAGLCLVVGLLPGCQRPTPQNQPLTSQPSTPPPLAGYFQLQPVGSYAHLPDDAAAAAAVHDSTWEPRPDNAKYNKVTPTHLELRPVDDADRAYSPLWNKYILGRITGDFTGTTDEIFQWAAVKWGVPDNLLRAIAYQESNWRQSNFGDYVDNAALCPPGYNALPCPVTFGIVGTKSTSWPGLFPWNRDSTAAAVDVLGAWLRGCDEGWAWWLGEHGNTSHGVYQAGNIWGCVGAWYSGSWLDGTATTPHTGENYIAEVQTWMRERPWLSPGF
jgi:hypothetical protein